MSLHDRLRRLEQPLGLDAPREYEVWFDEPDGTVRNVHTGERVTVVEFERQGRGGRTIPVTLTFDRPMVDADDGAHARGTP